MLPEKLLFSLHFPFETFFLLHPQLLSLEALHSVLETSLGCFWEHLRDLINQALFFHLLTKIKDSNKVQLINSRESFRTFIN